MAFKIGQKVVCVDASPCRATGSTVLVKGAIYTLRGIDYWPDNNGLYLEEIVRAPQMFRDRGLMERTFLAARFRPLIERKTETGMAILREILDRESFTERKPAKIS